MFKRYLIAGLLVWIPLAITVWLLGLIVNTMDQTLLLLPASWRPDALLPFHVPGHRIAAVVVDPRGDRQCSPPTSSASGCCDGGTAC